MGKDRSVCPACSALRRKSRSKCLWTSPDGKLSVCYHCGYVRSDRAEQSAAGRREFAIRVEREKLARWALNQTKIAAIWARGRPVRRGDAVDIYLRSRAIYLDQFPVDIRFVPSLRYYNDNYEPAGSYPAMLCAVRNRDGELIAVHRIYLSAEGGKAPVDCPKKLSMTAGSMDGAAIRFQPARPDGVLAVAEGPETALAAFVGAGLPTWSAISASGLEAFRAPAGVRKLLVLADNDTNGVGLRAAEACAFRARAAGIVARVMIPDDPGTDFNDVLISRMRAVAP